VFYLFIDTQTCFGGELRNKSATSCDSNDSAVQRLPTDSLKPLLTYHDCGEVNGSCDCFEVMVLFLKTDGLVHLVTDMTQWIRG
jgi:hypothetical protein